MPSYKRLFTAALLSGLALAAPVTSPANSTTTLEKRYQGGVNWQNLCSQDVYFWIAGPSFNIGPYTLGPGDWSTNSQPPVSGTPGNPDGGYVAKFSFSDVETEPYQMEYAYDGEYIWYDFSAQNGDPFLEYGSAITPRNGPYGGDYGSDPTDCPKVSCPAGDDSSCSYQGTDPAGPVHHCTAETTINAYLCNSG